MDRVYVHAVFRSDKVREIGGGGEREGGGSKDQTCVFFAKGSHRPLQKGSPDRCKDRSLTLSIYLKARRSAARAESHARTHTHTHTYTDP